MTAGCALALALPFVLDPFRVSQLTLVLIYAIAILGLNLLVGYGGQISVGHGAFFALGAYVAALLVGDAGLPYPVAIVAAGIATLTAGFVFGLPALRLRGLYLALVTFALAVTAPALIRRFDGLTGGSQGMRVEQPVPPDWMPVADDQFLYLVALTVAAGMFGLGWRITRGRLGRAVAAVRHDEVLARSLGVDAGALKTRLFAVSALYAGVAGALYALAVGFVAPESFSLLLSLTFLVGAVVGGARTIAGALLGALFIEFVPEAAHEVNEALTGLIYGTAIMLVLYVARGGVAGLIARASSRAAVVIVVVLAVAVTGCGRGGNAEPEDGISQTEVSIGGSYPFSGPVSVLSTLATGARAYFSLINERGGVDGRKIRFVTLDDGYQPVRALENARRLVEKERVFALFGMVGTANNLAMWDYANARRVPHLFLSTGASDWGANVAAHPYTIGWPPTYRLEGRFYADFLEREHPGAEVAVLYQNDAYGKELLDGFESSLRTAEIIAEETYEPTDPSVAPQVSKLASSGADVFLSITAPKPSAQAIKQVARLDWRPLHILNIAGSQKTSVIEPAGFENAQGIVSATFFKDPASPRWKDDPAMVEYRAAIGRFARRAEPEDPALAFGYASAQTLVAALDGMRRPTREALMESVRSLDVEIPMLLPGVRVTTGPGDGYPIEALRLMRFRGEDWQLVGEAVPESAR